MSTRYNFFLQDAYTHASFLVASINLKIDPKPSLAAALSQTQLSAIAGGVVGGVVLVLVLSLLVILLLREQRKNAAKPHNFETMLAALNDLYIR